MQQLHPTEPLEPLNIVAIEEGPVRVVDEHKAVNAVIESGLRVQLRREQIGKLGVTGIATLCLAL
ncbi:hypothetical protein Fmac_024546 [Flemingia macrophylla]|uniref:Uncharacterized protein n=1 Tax=Flemingia macrophylla TaxID=520843 RepID=A0ABD1LQ76_9FABA